MNEPSGLLIFGILFGLIVGILCLMAAINWIVVHATRDHIAAAAEWIWRAIFPPEEVARRKRSKVQATRLRSRPIRGAAGRFNGALPAVPNGNEGWNEPERGFEDRSASERAVPGDNDVPIVPVSVPEIVAITMRLGEGMAPSDIAKTLPGYSARNYQTYMAKVRQVKAEMDAQAPQARPGVRAEAKGQLVETAV